MTATSSLLSTAQRLFLRGQAILVVRKPFDVEGLLRALAEAAERVRRPPDMAKAHALGV